MCGQRIASLDSLYGFFIQVEKVLMFSSLINSILLRQAEPLKEHTFFQRRLYSVDVTYPPIPARVDSKLPRSD
jgi:hypothetical protein